MTSTATFGFFIDEEDNVNLPVVEAAMSIVGLVGTAPAANAAIFPLDTPVFFNSTDQTFLTALGTSGTLYNAIADINEQLGDDEVAAQIVVVRCAVGVAGTNATGTATISASTVTSATVTNGGTGYSTAPTVTLSGGGGTGATATAQITAGVVSGITITNPGANYTSAPTIALSGGGGTGAAATAQLSGGAVTAINVTAAGSNYVIPPTITLSGGSGTGASATAVLNPSTGAVASVTITGGGTGYLTAPTVAFSPAPPDVTTATIAKLAGNINAFTGVNALLEAPQLLGKQPRLIAVPGYTSQLTGGANAVCAALPAVLNSLRAVAVVDGPATNAADAVTWRNTLSSKRIVPLETAIKELDANANVVVRPGSAAILGIAVRRDYQAAGIPSGSWANQPISGIVGPSRPIGFSLLDGATEGQQLLAANLGIIVRGQTGVDSAIANGGFVYIGTDTTSPDATWQFYHEVRIADFIVLTCIRSLRPYLGVNNITRNAVTHVINTLKEVLDGMKAANAILGYKIDFTAADNTASNLMQGRLKIGFDSEPPPVLRQLTLRTSRYTQALDDTIAGIVADLAATNSTSTTTVNA